MAVESDIAKERRRKREAKARARYRLRTNELAESLGKTPYRCERCGKESKRKGALHWHHVDAGAKEFNLAHARSQSDDAVLAELAKCERICKSCHRYHHSVASQGTIAPRPECSFEVRFTVPTKEDAERLRDMVVQAKLNGEIHVEIRPEVEEAKRLLEAEGWAVVQSDGCADLWAATREPHEMEPGESTHLRLIQVKTDKRNPYDHFSPRERQELASLAAQTGGVAELCWWPARRDPVWLREADWPKAPTPLASTPREVVC
jgi:hypothetical protein